MTQLRTAIRRLGGLSLGTCLVTIGLAQPPVPLYGVAPAIPSPAVEAVEATRTAQESAVERATRLTAEVADLRRRKDEAYERLRGRARGLYRLRRSSPPPTGGFPSLLARVSRLERLERVLLDDVERYKSLERRLVETQREKEQADRAVAEAARRVEQAEATEAAIAAQYGYGDLGLPTVGSLAVAPMPSLGQVPMASLESAPAATSGFALLRGRLGMPVTTTLGVRDAVRDDGPGLEFVARPGTTVIAVAEGRVAFAAEYGSYGRMVILDHGDTFYTIYSGFGRTSARVGDYVMRGGNLGEVGGGTSPALFFEVRRGTRSLDTRNWVGLGH